MQNDCQKARHPSLGKHVTGLCKYVSHVHGARFDGIGVGSGKVVG